MSAPSERLARFPVIELFGPTIQGEGIMTGTVTHFLRLGGCGLRCTWCDSMYAVDPQQIRANRTMMDTHQLLTSILAMPRAPYLTLTGGDPAMHKRLGEIIPALNMNNIKVAIETQGEIFPDWLPHCDVITFSPKGPSSGNVVDPLPIRRWLKEFTGMQPRVQRVCIKVVCFNEEDYGYALNVYQQIPAYLYDAFYFTAGTPIFDKDLPADATDEEHAHREHARVLGVLQNTQALAAQMLRTPPQGGFHERVHLGNQMHVLLWPDKDKGV